MQGGGNGDRLSSLPEPIIHYIFSFLETIDAVRASAVSRKWRYFWVSMPYLSIDFDTVWNRRTREVLTTEKFKDFVNWVLMSRNRSVVLQTFRLCHLSFFDDDYTLYRWIDVIAAQRHLQELDLKICSCIEIELPQCIFSCPSLVSLKLHFSNGVLKQHTIPGFRRLKSLDIRFVKFMDSLAFGNFVSSCPLLENLTMHRCIFHDLGTLDITAPSLKNLSLNLFCLRNYELKVACPNLVSLNVLHLSSLDLSFQEMNSLENLLVDLHCLGKYVSAEQYCHVMSKICKAIRNVKALKLSEDFLEYLHLAVDKSKFFSTSFNNLKSLTLCISFADYNKQSLINLLNCSPNLEALKLFFPLCEDCNARWNMPNRTISCLKYRLKIVELIYFGGDKYKLDLVRFLLRNGHVLQKMSFLWDVCVENTDEIISYLMRFHVSSSNVALTFIDPDIDISFYD